MDIIQKNQGFLANFQLFFASNFCRNGVDEVHFGAPQPWQSQITCKIHWANGIRPELVPRVPKSARSTSFLHFGTTWPLPGKWPGHTQEGAN